MLLLKTIAGRGMDTEVWRARTQLPAGADEVLDALTDPHAIAEWAPVSFEVEGLSGGRLRAGSRERVTGSVAGISTAFDVDVRIADDRGLELVARGPVSLEVSYRFHERGQGVLVEAAVTVPRQRGLAAQVLRAAVTALLNAGALASALSRLEKSLSQARPLAARNWCATAAGSC